MTPASADRSLALIVRNPPYSQRAARADLDLALAAAAMDCRLEVYFLGSAVLQLSARRDSSAALLPPGYKAWAALPDLADFSIFGEQQWLDRCALASIELILPVSGLQAEQMSASWRLCHHVLVL